MQLQFMGGGPNVARYGPRQTLARPKIWFLAVFTHCLCTVWGLSHNSGGRLSSATASIPTFFPILFP
jgi:hypothetical protein